MTGDAGRLWELRGGTLQLGEWDRAFPEEIKVRAEQEGGAREGREGRGESPRQDLRAKDKLRKAREDPPRGCRGWACRVMGREEGDRAEGAVQGWLRGQEVSRA